MRLWGRLLPLPRPPPVWLAPAAWAVPVRAPVCKLMCRSLSHTLLAPHLQHLLALKDQHCWRRLSCMLLATAASWEARQPPLTSRCSKAIWPVRACVYESMVIAAQEAALRLALEALGVLGVQVSVDCRLKSR